LAIFSALFAMLGACTSNTEPTDSDEDEALAGEFTNEENLTEVRNIRGLDKMGAKEIALTFDDGPRAHTIPFAQWLKEQGVVATFFMTGNSITTALRESPTQIAAMGHLIANHTYTHPITPPFARLSSSAMVSEVARTDALIKSAIPAGTPSFLRTSGGSWNEGVSRVLNNDPSTKHYIGNIFWDIGGSMDAGYGADWACWTRNYNLTPAQCGARYMKEIEARGKGIVLLHDIHVKTIEMVKTVLVPQLKAKGYKFVRMDQIRGITNVP
jgi:peptidoglycan/xylan/chitin deacetylase (PgdA/CDA1 family)